MKAMRLRARKATDLSKIVTASLLLTLATVAVASLTTQREESMVMVYDTAELENLIRDTPQILVFVEQHSCPSCAALRPYVEELPKQVSGLLVVGYYIDSAYAASRTDTLGFIRAYGIKVTPTLLLFANRTLVRMHEGLFMGDQWEGLMEFVSGVATQPRSEGNASGAPGGNSPAFVIPAAVLLGAAAALSPCSLPLMISFGAMSAASRRSVLMREIGKASATVIASVVLTGIVLGWVGTAGVVFMGLPALDVVALFAAYFTALWGLAEIGGREVVSPGLTAVSGLLPALGLQCSLPFFMAALSLSTGPIPALATAAGFSLGFSAPYILAVLGLTAALSPAVRLFGRSGKLRGAVLLAVGAYLMYEVFVV